MPEPLFRRMLVFANLFEAWLKVRANGGCAGADGVTLSAFSQGLEERLAALRADVLAERYRPAPLLRVLIEPEGRKARYLAIPTVRDRVLQTAACQVLAPLFEAEFEEASFGYRRGRSVRLAVERVMRYRAEGYRWVVDADISAYFDNVDHDLLMAAVRELITEPRLLALIEQWVRAEVTEAGRTWRLPRGVAQGAPISPHLANLFLDTLDEVLLDENHRLVRYADDFLVLCKDRARAEDALEVTEEVLRRLNLRLNTAKTRITHFDEGFRFLGVRFIRSLAVASPYGEDQPSPAPVREAPPAVATPSLADQRPAPEAPPETGGSEPGLPPAGSLGTPLADAFLRAGWHPGEGGGDTAAMPKQPVAAPPMPAAAEPGDTAARSEVAETDAPVADTAAPPSGPGLAPALAAGEEIEALHPETPNGEAPNTPRRAGEPLLRTLYVLEPGCTLAREDERLVLSKDGAVLQEVPVRRLDLVLVLGNTHLTMPALRLCLEAQVPLALLTSQGRFVGMVDAFDTGPVLLQRAQFERAADPAFALALAKAMVAGKVANARLVLRRFARKRDTARLDALQKEMGDHARAAQGASTLDALRGFEGAAAKKHYEAMALLLPPEWGFAGRNRQPPRDAVNALLSYGYTLLFHNVYALLRARGLNPHVGFLHPARPGHPALVSDLMEEFRSLAVDSLVLGLCLRAQLQPGQFEQDAEGACTIGLEARRLFIHAFEARMAEPLADLASGERADYRRAIDGQVRQLAALVRGSQAAYRPRTLQ